MKKLLVAVILAVVLTLTMATPAFAGPPEDKPGNMPDGPGNMPDEGRDGVSWAKSHPGIGYGIGWGRAASGGQGWAYGPNFASLRFILGGWGSFGYWFDDPYAPGIFRVWVCPWD